MGGKHSFLSPSDAPRWGLCSKAPTFTAGIPAQEVEEFTAEGTAAHSIREASLSFGFEPHDFIGTVTRADGYKFEIDEAMADNLKFGIDEILEFDGKLFVERYIDLTEWLGLDPEGNRQGGTLDAGVVGAKLHIISDLKYGEGVAVSPVKNFQQMLYALGFWREIASKISDAKHFLIIIDQPRNSAGGGYWHVTLDELLEFGEWIKTRSALTRDPNAVFTPGEKQCAWCPAANVPKRPGGCPAHHQWKADMIGLKFDDLDKLDSYGLDWKPPPFASLTPERRAHITRVRGGIIQWLEKLHADELALRIDKGPSCGLKAVSGRRPASKWRAPEAAEAYLAPKLPADKLFSRKLISPTQAIAALGKKATLPTALVERGDPKPILVSDEDSRPSLKTVDEKFDAMSDTDI